MSSLRGWGGYSFSPSSRQSEFCSCHPAYRGALWQRRPAQYEETVKRLLHGLCHRSCGFLNPAGRESLVALRVRAEHQNPAQRLLPLSSGQNQHQLAAFPAIMLQYTIFEPPEFASIRFDQEKDTSHHQSACKADL